MGACCAKDDGREEGDATFDEIDAPASRKSRSFKTKRGASGRAGVYETEGNVDSDTEAVRGSMADNGLSTPGGEVDVAVTPVPAADANVPVSNIARGTVLAQDDIAAARKERETMRAAGDVAGPKMMQFDMEEEEGAEEDAIAAADDEAVIEAFNNDAVMGMDESPSKPEGIQLKVMNSPGSGEGTENDNGLSRVESEGRTSPVGDRRSSVVDEADEPPTSAWFLANGFQPPQVVWYQTPTHINVFFSPADANSSGWDFCDNYKLSFNSTSRSVDYGVELRLLENVEDVSFTVEDGGSVLHVEAAKCTPKRRWAQLLKGSKRAYFDLTWITKDMTREVDEDSEDDEDEDN